MKYAVWLWHNTRGIRLNTAVRIVAGVAQVVLGLLTVWLSKRFIDETIRTGSRDDVVRMVLWLVLAVTGEILLRQLVFYLGTQADTRQRNRLRLRMFGNLFRRRLYDDSVLHSGDVASRLAKDIEVVCAASTDVLPQLIVTGLQLCGAFLLMRWFDARLAWAILLLSPPAIVFGKLVTRKLRHMTLDIRNDESHIQMQVQEGMEYNAVLRSLGSEAWVTDRLAMLQEQLRGNVMRRARFTVVTRFFLACVFGLGYMLAFVWGGLQLRAGVITFGVMTSFLQLVGKIQHPLLQMLNMIPVLIHSTASIDRLEELEVEEGTDRQSPAEGSANAAPRGCIVFRDVSFRYAKGDREILSRYTHVFAAGSKTAILGETGVGKTTLFRLILGFITPSEGRVDVGGTVSFVPQGNTLMSGTVRYNLLLAKPDATDEELKAALHSACADFVGDLPAGLDTELGERGGGLSEGQAQRIAIARGLLRDSDILLLDEISSALDEPTERELCRRLFSACPHKTMLFITHRPAVSELCDNVVRIDKLS